MVAGEIARTGGRRVVKPALAVFEGIGFVGPDPTVQNHGLSVLAGGDPERSYETCLRLVSFLHTSFWTGGRGFLKQERRHPAPQLRHLSQADFVNPNAGPGNRPGPMTV